MFTKFMELTKFIHLLLLKKLITYICGFDPCREQHQVVTNSLYESETLFESKTLYQSENLKCILPNLQVLKRLFNYHCSKFRIEACLIKTTASEGATRLFSEGVSKTAEKSLHD